MISGLRPLRANCGLKSISNLFTNLPIHNMVQQCCICHSQPISNIVLFSFPSAENMREKWANFANISVKDITSSHCLCSRHFEKNDFFSNFEAVGKQTLKENAVPSIHCDLHFKLPECNPESNKKESMLEINRLKGFTCAICGLITCDEHSFHRFPVNKDIRSKWVSFCGIDLEEVKDWHGLCDKHFTKDDFISNMSYTTARKLLKRNSVPSQIPPISIKMKQVPSGEVNFEIIEVTLSENVTINENVTSDCDVNDVHQHDSSTNSVQPSFPLANSDQSKRTFTSYGRRFPRYFMDIKSQDVCSPKYAKLCLEMGQQAVLKYRKRIDTLRRENKKLQSKLLSSEEVFLLLKNNAISMDEAVRTIERRNIFKFADKDCVL